MLANRIVKVALASLLLAVLVSATSPELKADSIDSTLRAEAPRIMAYLRGHGYHTAGVLKFSVKKGAQAESLNTGSMNATMATRLEHALILLNDPSKPIDILHDAGRVAAVNGKGATSRSIAGRRALFSLTYPVAWGGHTKKPDAFLTGEVVVDKDMKKYAIIVKAFDAKKPDAVDEVIRVKGIPTDRNFLASIGQSFVLPRRLVKKGARDLDDAAADDASERDDTGGDPLKDPDDPVKLEIFYDGSPVALEPDAGSPGEVRVKASKAADPKEGQKVKFVLTNVSKETVGVVLAVNGKSTLFLEDLTSKSPGTCAKWILAPGEVYTVEGFYMSEDGKDVRGFKVLSDEESAKSDLAPDQKGVYSLFVFRPLPSGTTTALNISAEGGELARSPKPHTGTRSLTDLQSALHAANHTHAANGKLVAERPTKTASPARHAKQKGGRGLVVEDTTSSSGGTLKRIDTTFDPQPAMSLSIRYYSGPTSAVP